MVEEEDKMSNISLDNVSELSQTSLELHEEINNF